MRINVVFKPPSLIHYPDLQPSTYTLRHTKQIYRRDIRAEQPVVLGGFFTRKNLHFVPKSAGAW